MTGNIMVIASADTEYIIRVASFSNKHVFFYAISNKVFSEFLDFRHKLHNLVLLTREENP